MAAARKGMVDSIEAIGAVSLTECPRRIGNLEGSWYVEKSEEEGSLTVVAGYRAAHAVPVHEMQDPTKLGNPVHWTKPGSKPKFLEDPFNRYKDEIPHFVASKVAEAVEGKGGGTE